MEEIEKLTSQLEVIVISKQTKEKLSSIKIQRFWKRFLIERKINIFLQFKRPSIITMFEKTIKGWHTMNRFPIKEKSWEDINAQVIEIIGKIEGLDAGSHLSGKDMKYLHWGLSNKTIKSEDSKIAISSYRLTKVCKSGNPGDIINILEEINNRSSNYDFYSLLLRDNDEGKICYEWYIIPKNFFILNPNLAEWRHMEGKISRNRNEITGWEGTINNNNVFKIQFSMSSQFWITFDKKKVSRFLITKIDIDTNEIPRLSYAKLYDIIQKNPSFFYDI